LLKQAEEQMQSVLESGTYLGGRSKLLQRLETSSLFLKTRSTLTLS
jgi:hypothetical protein